MFIINRCFKNIWLESQMIHVALFSFQRTTLSFEARFRLKGFASSDSFIVPHLFQTVKNFFIFLFVWVIRSSKALPIKERCSRLSRCLAATCIILQDAQPFVNRYLELFLKNLHAASDVLRFTMIRKKHRFRDAHLHMAGVAGLEPTHAGFRDPCLTNLAIPLCLQPVAVNRNHYSVSLASWQVFFSVFLKTWYKKRRYPFTGVWLCYNIVDIDLWRSWRLWRCLMDIVYI